ncbi:MAG: family 10 glycosylhydrolase [Candidatus Edwardsbacteria bacterium]
MKITPKRYIATSVLTPHQILLRGLIWVNLWFHILVSSVQASPELRGLWVVRYTLTTPQKVYQMLESAEKNNFNAIFVQVYARGEAFYPSRFVPLSRLVKRGFDPLALIVKEAHHRGLEVHTWLNIYYAWSFEDLPRDTTHLLNLYPWSSLVDESGRPLKDYTSKEFARHGLEGTFVSPADLWIREYLLEIVREIVLKYDVDGIHLDYIRYPGLKYGYDVSSRSEFMRQFYVDPYDFLERPGELTFQLGRDGYLDLWTKWERWKVDRVTEFVKNVRQELSRMNPWVKLSAAVIPDYQSAYSYHGQDWGRWLQEGLVDFVVPMCYDTQINTVIRQIRNGLAWVNKGDLIAGIAVYNQSVGEAIEKISAVRHLGVKGVVLFSYDAIADKPEYFQRLRHSVFWQKVGMPDIACNQ